MDDFQTAIDNLEAASKGEDVKAALIALLNVLEFLEADVEYLNKKEQGYYVLKETIENYEYEKMTPFRTIKDSPSEPISPSAALMTGGNLYDFFMPILDKLRSIAGIDKKDPEYNVYKDYQALLTYIYEYIYDSNVGIKAAIESNKSKITGDNIVIPDTMSLLDYDQKILEIDKGAEITVEPLKVTVLDGTYDADTDHTGKAYNPVVVDVPLKVGHLDAKLNDTYDASEYGYDVWATAVAHVPVENPNKTSSSGKNGKKGDDNGADSKYNLMSKEVTSNGEYSAASEDPPADGYSDVDASNVRNFYVDPNKEFEVTFQDHNGKELKKVTVRAGESVALADYPAVPEHENTGDIWVFNCWNPLPVNVLSNMIVVSEFSRYQGPPTIRTNKVPGNYITASWEEICSTLGTKDADGRAIPVGAIKPLFVRGAGIFRMKKVKGIEGSAASVWMSIDRIGLNNSNGGSVPFTGAEDGRVDETKVYSWKNSKARQWLNGTFLTDFLPECLQKTITTMDKWHIHTDDGTNFEWSNTQDKIWPVSIQELGYYAQGEIPDEFGVNIPIGSNGSTYAGPYFQEHFGKSNLTRFPLSASFYGGFKKITIERVPDASIRDKLECILPHTDDPFTYFDPDTGETSTETDFDKLAAYLKVNQIRHYSLPPYDFTKFMDYDTDIPNMGYKYIQGINGLIFGNSGGLESGRWWRTGLRDSGPIGSYSRGRVFIANQWYIGWNDGSSRDIPIAALDLHDGVVSYPLLSTSNIDYRICFGLGTRH